MDDEWIYFFKARNCIAQGIGQGHHGVLGEVISQTTLKKKNSTQVKTELGVQMLLLGKFPLLPSLFQTESSF